MKALLTLLCCHALLALATTLPAQARKPCFITVVDDDDEPLAGAAVTLAFSPGWGAPGVDDVVRVTTDSRGRCQPDLVVGRLYTVWGISKAQPDGSRLVTEPTDRGSCGAVVRLTACHRQVNRQVTISGLDDGAAGPDTRLVHLPLPIASLAEELVSAAGHTEVPPSPWATTWIGLRDRNGALLQIRAIEPWDQTPKIEFLTPRAMTLQVVDAQGAPIENVSVSMPLSARRQADSVLGARYRNCLRTVTVGPGGDLRVPDHEAPGFLPRWMSVSAPGFEPKIVAVAPDRGGESQSPTKVVLAPARDVTIRLLGLADDGPVAAQLLVRVEASSPDQNMTVGESLPMSFADGALHAAVWASVRSCQLVAQLPPRTGSGLPRHLSLPERNSVPAADAVRIDDLRAFTIEVNEVGGGRCGAAEIAVVQVTEGFNISDSLAIQAVADVAGRCELLLGDGAWGIYATDGRSHVLEFIEPDQLGRTMVLQLEAIPTATFRILDASGAPVPNARFEPHQSQRSGFSGVLRGPKGWTKEALAARVAYPLVLGPRSDRAGMLVVPVQDWRPWEAGFRVRAGARVSDPIQFPVGASAVDVVVK